MKSNVLGLPWGGGMGIKGEGQNKKIHINYKFETIESSHID